LLRAAGLTAIVAPLARLGWLWSRNNPLPPVENPDIRVVDNWVLDSGDLQ